MAGRDPDRHEAYCRVPKSRAVDLIDYVRSLAAISYADLWFWRGLWALAHSLGVKPWPARA
jgi:hypothetical protein